MPEFDSIRGCSWGGGRIKKKGERERERERDVGAGKGGVSAMADIEFAHTSSLRLGKAAEAKGGSFWLALT
jgi:hypothetical protein